MTVALAVGAAVTIGVNDGPRRRPVSPTPAAAAAPVCAPADPTVAALRTRLSADQPGVGIADYPGSPTAEIPKAQAAIVLAEVACAKADPSWDRSLLKEAGEQLLTWPVRHPGPQFGWGLPFAWDAFGDGSENPAGTVYSVSTGVAVKALLDWADISDGPTQARIDAVVDQALQAWLVPEAFTAGGQLAYSLAPADRAFDVFNSSVVLAGQMMRFAALGRSERSAAYVAVADRVMTSLVEHHLTDRSGYWYWPYSLQEDTPNDLTHAGYVIDGVTSYVAASGSLSSRLPLDLIAGHLAASFVSDGTIGEAIMPWPTWRSPELTDPRGRVMRLYDDGWTLYQSSLHPDALAPMLDAVCSDLRRHRDPDGTWHRYPVDAGLSDANPEILEYVAYAYLGLVTAGADACKGDGGGAWQEVPFVQYRTTRGDLRLSLERSTHRARLVGDTTRLDVGFPGVPQDVFTAGDDTVAVVRRIPTSDLVLARWRRDVAAASTVIPAQADVSLMYRAGLLEGDVLYLVVYDNATRQNRLQRYRWSSLTLEREWVLPSVQDPAGGTYEMEPRVFLAATADGLDVVAGTLAARLVGDDLREGRLEGCVKALELVSGASGSSVLCTTPEGGYAVEALGAAPRPVDTTGVPYRLRVDSTGALAWDDSATSGLADWLRFEIEHGAGCGTLELGVNNWEGRVPWSQIYYLNGMLDIVGAEKARPLDDALKALIPTIRTRLQIEMDLLDSVLAQVGYEAKAFTVDRSPGLFAVQTGRLSLLYTRYRTELPGAPDLPAVDAVAHQSASLVGHEEVIDRDGMTGWVPRGRAFLAWPKGSAFSYDGTNVPFNHQNEWAQGVLRSGRATPQQRATATDILSFFANRVLGPTGDRFPDSGTWPYWWGIASTGWTEADGISVNHPSYVGDKGEAWISFRSIDAESMLVWSTTVPEKMGTNIRDSVSRLLVAGSVLPHVASTLVLTDAPPDLPAAIARRFGRATTPSELADAFWAQLLAVKR